MICNLCNTQEATIHLTEIVNGKMVEFHLCESCANEKGADFKTHFNLFHLLSGMPGFESASASEEKEKNTVCKACGMTYEQFSKHGRLGCPACYEGLAVMLLPLIKRVQQGLSHVGKRPSRVPKKVRTVNDLRRLQQELRKCVELEQFEKAAQLRDDIKKIQDEGPSRKKAKSDGND
ncbi:MAG: UvrB/UvrC motif-containing protein [Candidatus Omnitrophota bacterium]